MSQPISTNSATITTPTISVRQVNVDGKFMTLKTFRQIPEEAIIDTNNHCLKGEAWGWVNYFWPENKSRKHTGAKHILWQKGDELRRCFINGNYSDNYGWRIDANDENWKILSLTYDDRDFMEETMLIKASINKQVNGYSSIVKLLEEYGSGAPTLPVYRVENVREIIRPIIESYNGMSFTQFSEDEKFGKFTRFSYQDKFDNAPNHFFRVLRETTEYGHYADATRKMLIKNITDAHLVYTSNHLAPLNVLVSQIHKQSRQLFV